MIGIFFLSLFVSIATSTACLKEWDCSKAMQIWSDELYSFSVTRVSTSLWQVCEKLSAAKFFLLTVVSVSFTVSSLQDCHKVSRILQQPKASRLLCTDS